MHTAIRDLTIRGGLRLKALLRVRRFFTVYQMVMLYKAQVLSFLESGCSVFIYTPATTMKLIDRIQARFLHAIGLSEVSAFLDFNLAPMIIRRQITALGILHKRILGLTPSVITELLPFAVRNPLTHQTRLAVRLHDKQLEDRASGIVTEMFRRSLFGYVGIYNRLPQGCINLPNVKSFQAHLQSSLRNQVQMGNPAWRDLLASLNRISDIRVFQQIFQIKI